MNESTSTFRTTTRNSSGPTNPSAQARGQERRDSPGQSLRDQHLQPLHPKPPPGRHHVTKFGNESQGISHAQERKSLEKPGVQAEFIGNGKSSRTLVTKGNLRILEKSGQPGTSSGSWTGTTQNAPRQPYGSRERICSKQGRNHPYPVQQPPGQTGPGSAGRFLCALAQLDHLSESYKLDAAIHLDRESLVEERRPSRSFAPSFALTETLSTDLLEETKLIIHSSDHDGTPGMMEIDLPKLNKERTSFMNSRFRKLSTLASSSRTKVQNLSKAAKQSLRRDRTFTVSQMDPQTRGSLCPKVRANILSAPSVATGKS